MRTLIPSQRWLLPVAFVCLLHYALGTCLWSLLIYVQTEHLLRNSRPGQFTANLMAWLPFYFRAWKSVIPLILSVWVTCFGRVRPRSSAILVCLILAFTVVCSIYDIQHHDHDFATLSPETGHLHHYFTWWWWHTRY